MEVFFTTGGNLTGSQSDSVPVPPALMRVNAGQGIEILS